METIFRSGTTKPQDIFMKLVNALDKLGGDWTKFVSLATDGAPHMLGSRRGTFFEK